MHTPPGWEMYNLINDPHETQSLYNDSDQTALDDLRKHRMVDLRQRVGDDATHYPQCEKIVQEFWDYDETDRAKAIDISQQYLQRRKEELEAGKRSVQTHKGK